MDAPALTTPRLRIGLTGGVGSGKSSVAALLARHGAAVIDTDLIAHELTAPQGAAVEPIAAAFGADLIDVGGALDRARMRALVFSEPTAKQRLEAILHPLIGIETERRASTVSLPVVVFDVPLLVESGRWRARVDKVLVVDCFETTQIERVVARSHWTVQAVRAVIDQQATRDLRRACADALIFNDAITPEQLAIEVASLWRRWAPTPP